MNVFIRAVGSVDADILSTLGRTLEERFSARAVPLEPLAEPPGAFDAKRGQHSSVALLKAVMDRAPDAEGKVLGVTERDLFIPMLTFVFGQAQLDGRFALVSLARLRQEFYGLPGSRAVLESRAIKETCHELGHTFGLAHCADPRCPMSLSTTIRQVDGKGEEFCELCAASLRARGFARQGAIS